MASTAERLQIIIDAQDRASKEIVGVQKQLQKVQTDVKKTSKEFGNAGQSISSSLKNIGGLIAGAFVVHEVVNFGKELYNTTVKLDQLDKKSNTVLGEFRGQVEKTAKEVAHSMGMTTNEFVSASTNIADLLIPMKFTREEASKMSTQLVSLSGALSEWTGGTRSATDVSQVLSKAILGEREQLKELGIAINETQVQQRLLEKGQQDLTGSALEQAKAQATLELIMEKSTDAQTAFKNGGDSLIRTQNELSAKTKQLKEDLARELGPEIKIIQTEFANYALEVLNNKDVQEALITTLKAVASSLKFIIFVIGEAMINIKQYGELIAIVTDIVRTEFETMRMNVTNSIKNLVDTGLGYWNSLKDGIAGVVGYIVDSVNTAVNAFNSLTGLGIGNIGGVDGARANGGPVRSGSTYLVGERGPELFVPRSSGSIVPNNNLGGVTVNLGGVTIANGRDERWFSSMLETELTRITRNLSLGVT